MALDENVNKHGQLVELGGSDYEIADGEPNIKGWDVKNKQGQLIGEVEELLFDVESRKVRYLIVDLDDDLEMDDKKVLIPIGVAELHDADDDDYNYNNSNADNLSNDTNANNLKSEVSDEVNKVEEFDGGEGTRMYDPSTDGDVVVVPIAIEMLASLPAYEKDNLTSETEASIRQVFGGVRDEDVPGGYDNNFYNHNHFDENNFYNKQNQSNKKLPVIEENLEIGKENVTTGGTKITSRIVERPIEKTINLKEEHATVDRNPVDRAAAATDLDAFKEEQIEITEFSEVPVVTKEARVVEEISLNKEVTEKEHTVRETLRNTEVETERINPDTTNLKK